MAKGSNREYNKRISFARKEGRPRKASIFGRRTYRVLSETRRIKKQRSIQKEQDDRQGKKRMANKPAKR